MTVGFVALWENNQREYHASDGDEWETTERIQGAFANGRSRGIRTYGLYNCRWSSAWHYFTFWVSPSLSAVCDTIADLEQAGDFKFADSEHIVGRFVEESDFLTDGAWDVTPEIVDGDPPPIGLFLAERDPLSPLATGRSCRPRRRLDVPTLTASLGIRMYGAFDCRFGTGWERFTFWTAPDVAAVEGMLGAMEQQGALAAGTRATIGRLDRYFRFGNHLQTGLTWLNEEVKAT